MGKVNDGEILLFEREVGAPSSPLIHEKLHLFRMSYAQKGEVDCPRLSTGQHRVNAGIDRTPSQHPFHCVPD